MTTVLIVLCGVECSAFLTSSICTPKFFGDAVLRRPEGRAPRLGKGLKGILRQGDQISQNIDPSIQRKVWKTDAPGDLKNLQLVTESLPPPGPGEVTVRIRCVGMNFADVFTVLGMYDAAPK